jgi:hypothetical protein
MQLREFSHLLDEEQWGTFGGTRLNKTRYLLLKLDFLHCNQQTRLAFNRAISTVEHILPRSPMDNDGDMDSEVSAWTHRLGNLVLLDRKKNSSLSNAGFEIKRERYRKNYETRPYTNDVFLKHSQWELDEIKNQHKLAVNMLVDYYRLNSITGLRRTRSR